jgi:hypothetical protein
VVIIIKLILDKVIILFNKVFSLTNGIVSVAFGFVCFAAATVDAATGAAIADDDPISTVVPPSLTKDKGAYVDVLVAFEGACVGGRGWQGRRPSVVICGSAVLDPAAERAPLDRCAVPPRLLHGARPISPSSSSHLCSPKTFHCRLPPLLIVKSPLAAGDHWRRRR